MNCNEYPHYNMDRVWSENVDINGRQISLETFYKQLHAYVRRKLKHFYSGQVSHSFYLELLPNSKEKLFAYLEFLTMSSLFNTQ